MKYVKLVIEVEEPFQESLIAELAEMEFDSFEQLEDAIVTCIPRERFGIGDRERIERLLAGFPGEGYIRSEELVADQNWNETWEETIRPQRIGRFLVRPTWTTAETADDLILLEIDPKMSFGTGYHETTRLMLKQLPSVIRGGEEVLDAGTGTGILAIAAVKLGVGHVTAFDIDEWSVTNTRENILLNGVDRSVTVRKGSMEGVPGDALFDLITANINRNTILEMMEAFDRHLKPGGTLLLSGLLSSDREMVEARLPEDLTLADALTENEWVLLRVVKRPA